MMKRIQTYFLRVLIGIPLILLPLLFLVSKGDEFRMLNPHEHVIQNLLTYGLLVLFSYVNHGQFVPRLYLTRRYVRYCLVVLGCLLGVMLIPQRIEQWVFLKRPTRSTHTEWIAQLFWRENLFPNQPAESLTHRPFSDDVDRQPPPPDRPPADYEPGQSAFRNERPPRPPQPGSALPLVTKFSLIFLLCSVSALASISVQTSNRLYQLEVDTLQAELGQLKAQIHPHFLFNTLNSIYALAIRKDDRTADTVVKLAEFMRYIVREAGHDRVPLPRELAYLQNYLDLQRARLRDAVQVSYVVTGTPQGYAIAPLLLFTFIENAFKHGVNPDEESRIQITIAIESRQLTMIVQNRKVTVHQLDDEGGLGLPNTRARLQLLYPRRHHLTLSDLDQDYRVELTIHFS